MKWINWKASARAAGSINEPLVNEPEPETRKAVWIFMDVADYMDVGVPLSNPLENMVEASGTLAQYYLSKGSVLGAYAFNTYGGEGEMLAPDSRMSQFNRLVQMLTRLRTGPPEQDLLQSVELCKNFLFRLRPDVFIITRLDTFYSMPGESTVSLERFKSAVRRLIALSPRSLAVGQGQGGSRGPSAGISGIAGSGPGEVGNQGGGARPAGGRRERDRVGACSRGVHLGTHAKRGSVQVAP